MFECKVCKVSKVRFKARFRDNGDPVFTDESGRHWNGHTCPACNAEKLAAARANGSFKPRDKSAPRKERRVGSCSVYGSKDVLYPPKLRPCRTCGVLNPNYYNCSMCLTERALHSPDTHVGCLEEDMYGVYV